MGDFAGVGHQSALLGKPSESVAHLEADLLASVVNDREDRDGPERWRELVAKRNPGAVVWLVK